jgi:hypothetical protein
VEVAALAGVSHITVSRVMHAHPSVRPATKARVEAAMQKLGYEPNPAARMLVTGKSQMIGVVCHNTALYGPAAALIGLEHAAAEHGYFTSMIALETLERDAVERAVSRLRQQAVAGVVLVSPQAAMAEAWDRAAVAYPSSPQTRPRQHVMPRAICSVSDIEWSGTSLGQPAASARVNASKDGERRSERRALSRRLCSAAIGVHARGMKPVADSRRIGRSRLYSLATIRWHSG